jgi:hypothetical protein
MLLPGKERNTAVPDFTLRDPNGEIHVVGNASDRARLLAQGYEDITSESTEDVPATDSAAADTASTPEAASEPKPARPTPTGKPRTGDTAAKPAADA